MSQKFIYSQHGEDEVAEDFDGGLMGVFTETYDPPCAFIIAKDGIMPVFFAELNSVETIKRFNYLRKVAREEGMPGVTRVYQDHLYPWLKKTEVYPE
jgi:hypothetical protein